MNKYAVIVAGGAGIRMGADIPKQFLLLKDKPVLHYTLQAFLDAYDDLQAILVLPDEHVARGEEIVQQTTSPGRVQIAKGGETRFHSVQNGLRLVRQPSVVFVHDGVRCLVSRKLIKDCFGHAVLEGNAVPAVAATESIRIDEYGSNYVIDRNKVRIIQTPQTFHADVLLEAFKQEYNPAFTDEATVVEAAGHKIFLVEGDYNNIKITRPLDLCIAEKLLEGFTS